MRSFPTMLTGRRFLGVLRQDIGTSVRAFCSTETARRRSRSMNPLLGAEIDKRAESKPLSIRV